MKTLGFFSQLTAILFVLLFTAPAVFGETRHDKEDYDVRLVAAYFDPIILTVGTEERNTVQLSDCREDSRQQRFSHGVHIYDNVSMDCGNAATAAIAVPVVGRFWVYADVRPGTLTPVNDQTVESAKIVRVFLASRKEAVRHSAGIGFYFGFNMSFVPVDQLSVFAEATMKESNDPAYVYQFAGLVTGTAFEPAIFKPYMEFRGSGATWRVWEDLTIRAGSGVVEGSFAGSGNYILRSNRTDKVKFTDVIQENHLITLPMVLPDVVSVRSEFRNPEISSVSVYPGKRDMELLLEPYVSTYPLRFSEEQAFVQTGTKLWVRFSDQIANGRDVKMFWSVNGSADQEAKNYLGGNCYGFKECFAVPVDEAAGGLMTYRFVLVNADGSETEYRNGDSDFKIAVRSRPWVTIAINKDAIQLDRSSPTSDTYALKYDPRRAIDLLRGLGKIADELSLIAIVSSDSGVTEYPLGLVRSWTDAEMRLHYIADQGLIPQILAVPSTLQISVKIKSRVRGIEDGIYTDVIGAVTVE